MVGKRARWAIAWMDGYTISIGVGDRVRGVVIVDFILIRTCMNH